MARCARRMRSSTLDLSYMTSPNCSFRACPNGIPAASIVSRSETMHCHGAVVRASLHSVGHLEEMRKRNFRAETNAYRVQVPDSRGRVIPEMASMSEDFPAL